MANKNQKANDALLMAILQAYQGNPQGLAAATAAMAMSDIKRDGPDQGDVHNIAANSVLDQAGDVNAKVQLIFNQHPEIEEALNKYMNDSEGVFNSLPELIQSYLREKRKYAEGGQFETNETWIDVQIGEKTYRLLVAETEEQKERGLMDVESMEPDEGMLFDYSDEPQAELSFWMKNTTIPLDIVFINQDGIVTSVKQGVPNSEEYITEDSEFISCVIELNINSGVKAGDKTDLFSELKQIEEDDEEDDENAYSDLKVNRLYVYGSDGEVQATLQGGERIFSRVSTRRIVAKAKKAYMTKDDKDYKALGRYVFKEMDAQDNRDPEYIDN